MAEIQHTLQETIDLAVKLAVQKVKLDLVPECVVDKGNGYIRYSSGLQMCWGRVTVNGTITATNTKVTFPVAFKLTPAVLTTGNANYLGNNVMVGWETATSFTIGTTIESPAVGETSWLAIGWWK